MHSLTRPACTFIYYQWRVLCLAWPWRIERLTLCVRLSRMGDLLDGHAVADPDQRSRRARQCGYADTLHECVARGKGGKQ